MAQASLESQLIALVDRLRVLYACREVASLLREGASAFCQLAEAERAFVFLPDPTTGSLALAHGQSRQGDLQEMAEARVAEVARRVFHDRREVIATDSPPQAPSARAPDTELRLRLLLCLPLVVGGRCLGVAYADGRAAPGEGLDARVVTSLAEHLAQALDNAQAFARATGDMLTGLPNASSFLGHLERALYPAPGAPAAGDSGLLLIDLDDFKRVNQAGGSEAGDRALCEVAHALRDLLQADGVVARYGSDKFAVLLPPDPVHRMRVRLLDAAERARAAIATRVVFGVRLSASIGGIALGAGDARKSPREVIAACDNMLARARARGSGHIEIA